jgi:hypothetical protein
VHDDEGGFVIVWRLVIPSVVVIVLLLGGYLYWFAEESNIRIIIDNQTTDHVLVSIYIDGEDFGHQRDSQWVNFSDIVDFDRTFSVKRGSHPVLVSTIVPDLEYHCNVSVGLFETEPISLRLMETSLEPT